MLASIYTAISRRLPTLSSSAASSSTLSEAQKFKMSVKSFVDSSIEDNKVTIFSKSWCPYCKRAKTLFAENFPEVKAAIYELDERDDGGAIQQLLTETTGQRTVPFVFVNKELIGGCDDTVASFKAGKLANLVNAPLITTRL